MVVATHQHQHPVAVVLVAYLDTCLVQKVRASHVLSAILRMSLVTVNVWHVLLISTKI
jgi:hypothetical protein